jgi:hypothetical protein
MRLAACANRQEVTMASTHEFRPRGSSDDEDDQDAPGDRIDFQEMERRVRSAVVAHPLAAVGTAVLAGYVVGRLFRR